MSRKSGKKTQVAEDTARGDSSDEDIVATKVLIGKKIDVIDLTVPVSSHETVDLTLDPTPVKKKNRRKAAKASYISDSGSDPELEEFPQMLPDFKSPEQSSVDGQTSSGKAKVSIHCPICFDGYEEISRSNRTLKSTTCGHVFCNACIEESVRSLKKCPTCRKKLTLKQLHPLYI